ncbi:MAG TPA: hypothetical protein VEU62_05795 [Bryobacterales bacterium]|nr:hypothetical protein [Bryobacterales bacterium]
MLNFSAGQQVKHERYGFGTVLFCDEERISIRFDDHGEKKFVRSIVLLEKSDREPPPEKRRASRPRKPKVAPATAAAK